MNLHSWEKVAVAIGVNKSTFYDHKLHESDEINEALIKNRVGIKTGLRRKWYDSDNATAQIALYRLISTDKEFERLTSQKVEHSGGINTEMTVNVITSGKPIAETEAEVESE